MRIDDLLDLDERLHGYQFRAVEHLWDHPRAGLFLEMGLGKTATVLQALTPEHLPALVVGPKRVAENVWPAEVALWRPDLTIAVSAGPPEKRRAALKAGADITAIGVANLKDVKPGWKTIVLDELSLFKNRASNRWRYAKQLCRFADHVWGLTGTPTPNGLLDLWSQLYLLDNGERLGTGKRHGTGIVEYRNRWFTAADRLPNGVITKWVLKPGAQEEITEAISDICLSMRTQDYLTLPELTFNTVTVPLPSKAMAAYKEMKDTMVAELENGTVLAANAAVVTGKLSQVTAGCVYHDDGTTEWVHDEKIHALQEIIDGTGSPVLVFHRFRAEAERMLAEIPGARSVTEAGVIDDWNAGRVPVMLAHPASAGHGLNLAEGGHTIVWTTLDFSAELWKQANARLHRQGQTQPVMVHVLESPGTVDVRLRNVVAGKVKLEDAVMEALR